MHRDTSATGDAAQLRDSRSLLTSALQVGALAGGGGVLLGGAKGIISSSTPGLFATLTGIHFFAAGSVYWATRSAILNRHGLRAEYQMLRWAAPNLEEIDTFSSKERVNASAIAGGVSGGVAGLILRGPSQIIPRMAVYSIFGYAGQNIYNFLDTNHTEREEMPEEQKPQSTGFLRRIADSRFSPVKILSDGEYEHMLKEKLLRVDTEIALIDESIDKLRQQQDQTPDVAER